MDNAEAARRVKEHTTIHRNLHEPHAHYINIALDMAVDALNEIDTAVDVIKDLLHQFAYSGEKDGKAMLWTGGLSALEWGFEFVGWDNPHFTPELECERTDCHAIAECGVNTPDGYERLCSKHYHELDLITHLLDNGSPLSAEENHAMNASIEKLYNKTGRKIIIGNEPI